MRPRSFVLVGSDHGPMIVNRNDFHQTPSGTTYGVGFQILTYGAYDPQEVQDVLQLLTNRRSFAGHGLIAVDCGANIGVHTVEMASHMTGWGKVIAIEPQQRLFYALCGNIALANLENATAVNFVVGAEDGFIDVPQPNYNKPGSFGSLEIRRTLNTEYIGQTISYSERDTKSVKCITIDNMTLEGLDFLKIDVEGMELDVLAGARGTVEKYKPIMLIEWIKSDRLSLEDFLLSHDYEFVERGANLIATPKTESKQWPQ